MINTIRESILLKKQANIAEANKVLAFIHSRISELDQTIKEMIETADRNADDTEMLEISDELKEITVHHLKHQLWLISQDVDELSMLINKG